MEERKLVRATTAINNQWEMMATWTREVSGKNTEKWSDSEYFRESTGCANNYGKWGKREVKDNSAFCV